MRFMIFQSEVVDCLQQTGKKKHETCMGTPLDRFKIDIL